MNSLDRAILRTVIYADLFDFPLTITEIHHFLIHDQPVDLPQVAAALAHSADLKRHLRQDGEHILFKDRIGLVEKRAQREAASQSLWPQALRYGRWLACLPFIRMVAVTGALAVHNAAGPDDDLDYMLVTCANRVWLARAFSIVLVRLAQRQGVTLCPNYVLAETALDQQRKDLFIAHEISQMIPLYGHPLYWQFRLLNAWTDEHLPNASAMFYHAEDYQMGGLWRGLKHLCEFALNGRLGNWLERWEYQRKLRRFTPDMQAVDSSAVLDENNVKGHFNDYGNPVLRRYHQRLGEIGLENTPAFAPGD